MREKIVGVKERTFNNIYNNILINLNKYQINIFRKAEKCVTQP